MIRWPWRRRDDAPDEKDAIDARVRDVTERAERVVPLLIAAQDENHFAQRIRATLRGT